MSPRPRNKPLTASRPSYNKRPIRGVSKKPRAHRSSGDRLSAGHGGGRPPHRIWGLMKWGILLALWGALIVAGIVTYYAMTMPDIEDVKMLERKPSITLEAADGTVIARYGGLKGEDVDVSDLPQPVIAAFLSIEDRRFYSHFGIDPIGFTRAMLTNVREARFVQGGSTITQQLAKNMFLTPDKTIRRKIQEALLALWLESEYTKDEILTAYLNRVYFGAGAYGIDSAAKTYFGKPAHDLSLYQSAVLAGLLKAPSRYSPAANPKAAKERAAVVLKAMEDAGYITEKQRKNPQAKGDIALEKSVNPDANRYFTDWAISDIETMIGGPIRADIIVKTTLNPRLQTAAAKALKDMIEANGAELKASQGAIVTQSFDGAVLALVGGKDYGESEYNRASTAERQPGSSFKPFVFLAALERGFPPGTQILDAPFTSGKYRPQNYDGKYHGDVNMATALALSLNTATIRLLQAEGVDALIDTAKRAGVTRKLRGELSLGLGSQEMTLLEMNTAYTAIANGGFRVKPYGILEIIDVNGKELYSRKQPQFERTLVRNAVGNVKTMMRYVVSGGTGTAASVGGTDIMGKTGTSQDYRDAWFIGFNDNLVTGVWMGNDDNSSMSRVSGGKLPAQLFRTYMTEALNGRTVLFDAQMPYDSAIAGLFGGGNVNVSASANAPPQADGFGGMLGRLFSDDGLQGSAQQPARREEGGFMEQYGVTPDSSAPVYNP